MTDELGNTGFDRPAERSAEKAAQTVPYSRPHRRENFKETVESIVVALILAFVFRAFVVEAFVIPTGSMAPTLYGAHGTVLCADCGTEFAYGLRDLEDKRRSSDIDATANAVCPNCNHHNSNLQFNDIARNPEKGDRILVLKWPFDLGISSLGPDRWDVIVFKDPSDGTTNFIKRCAGLPNEVLMILDGDVYSVPSSDLSPEAVVELEAYIHRKYEHWRGAKRGRLEPPAASVLSELDKKLRIARKTPEAQGVLWHKVYDHDYPPQQLDPNQPRWSASPLGGGWDTSGRRAYFQDQGQATDFIELTNKEIRATSAYNINTFGVPAYAPHVSDQRVRFVLRPITRDSTIFMRLAKRSRLFWAIIRTDGNVSLVESNDVPTDASPVMISRQFEPMELGKGVAISFENLDYRLSVKMNGVEQVASSSDRNSTAYYGPDVAVIRSQSRREFVGPPPRIYAQGGEFELTHLVVERDEHYFNDPRGPSALQALDWAPREGWGGPESPIFLRSHEFFMLGDNTAASKDSRLWDIVGPHLWERGEDFQLGTVPRDQLIGKAFFVYWPSGHRLEWVPALGRYGVIPDVGRMRWIR